MATRGRHEPTRPLSLVLRYWQKRNKSLRGYCLTCHSFQTQKNLGLKHITPASCMLCSDLCISKVGQGRTTSICSDNHGCFHHWLPLLTPAPTSLPCHPWFLFSFFFFFFFFPSFTCILSHSFVLCPHRDSPPWFRFSLDSESPFEAGTCDGQSPGNVPAPQASQE